MSEGWPLWVALYLSPGVGMAILWIYSQYHGSVHDGDNPPWPWETGQPLRVLLLVFAICLPLWPLIIVGVFWHLADGAIQNWRAMTALGKRNRR